MYKLLSRPSVRVQDVREGQIIDQREPKVNVPFQFVHSEGYGVLHLEGKKRLQLSTVTCDGATSIEISSKCLILPVRAYTKASEQS